MAWIHRSDTVDGAERDTRIARLVVRKLRAAGHAARLYDKRDPSGARVWPVNALCGHLQLLCRSAGHKSTQAERDFLAAHPGALLQLGASDVTLVVSRLKSHWNS